MLSLQSLQSPLSTSSFWTSRSLYFSCFLVTQEFSLLCPQGLTRQGGASAPKLFQDFPTKARPVQTGYRFHQIKCLFTTNHVQVCEGCSASILMIQPHQRESFEERKARGNWINPFLLKDLYVFFSNQIEMFKN